MYKIYYKKQLRKGMRSVLEKRKHIFRHAVAPCSAHVACESARSLRFLIAARALALLPVVEEVVDSLRPKSEPVLFVYLVSDVPHDRNQEAAEDRVHAEVLNDDVEERRGYPHRDVLRPDVGVGTVLLIEEEVRKDPRPVVVASISVMLEMGPLVTHHIDDSAVRHHVHPHGQEGRESERDVVDSRAEICESARRQELHEQIHRMHVEEIATRDAVARSGVVHFVILPQEPMQEEAVDAIDRQFEDEEEHAELPQSRKNILRDWVGPLDVSADNVRVHRKDGEVQRHDGHVFKWPGVLGHAGAQLKEVRP